MKGKQKSSGSSDAVREVAARHYIEPARGIHGRVKIEHSDLKARMVKLGFPVSNANQIGTSIETELFAKQQGVRLCSPKPQRRKNGTIYEFEFVSVPGEPKHLAETHQQRAFRITEKILGLMKDEISAHGGTEGFMRWVRSDGREAQL